MGTSISNAGSKEGTACAPPRPETLWLGWGPAPLIPLSPQPLLATAPVSVANPRRTPGLRSPGRIPRLHVAVTRGSCAAGCVPQLRTWEPAPLRKGTLSAPCFPAGFVFHPVFSPAAIPSPSGRSQDLLGGVTGGSRAAPTGWGGPGTHQHHPSRLLTSEKEAPHGCLHVDALPMLKETVQTPRGAWGQQGFWT